VATSYYTVAQFLCRPTVVDNPQGKAEIRTAQLADFQPEGGHAAVAAGTAPYGRMLAGIRGVQLEVLQVDAKFKYDDHNPVEHRERVIGHLRQRGHELDARRQVSSHWQIARICPGFFRCSSPCCGERRRHRVLAEPFRLAMRLEADQLAAASTIVRRRPSTTSAPDPCSAPGIGQSALRPT